MQTGIHHQIRNKLQEPSIPIQAETIISALFSSYSCRPKEKKKQDRANWDAPRNSEQTIRSSNKETWIPIQPKTY